MPRIPIYEQQQAPSGGMAVVRAAQPNMGGMQDLAQGLGQAARVVSQSAIDSARSDAHVWATKAAGEADAAMVQWAEEAKATMPPGAAGYTPAVLKQHDAYWASIREKAPNKFARDLITQYEAQSRQSTQIHAITWESHEKARNTVDSLSSTIDTSAKAVYGDPTKFGFEHAKVAATIDNALVDPSERAKLHDALNKNLAWYSAVGFVDKNPANALANLSSDKPAPAGWDLLSAADQIRAKNYAEQKYNELRQGVAVNVSYDVQNAEAMARDGVAPTEAPRPKSDFDMAYKDPEAASHAYARYITARNTATATAELGGKSTADLLLLMQRKPDANDPNYAVTSQSYGIQAQAAENIIRARGADPIAYAMQTQDFKFQPLDPNDTATFAAELTRRAAAYPVMREKYGVGAMLSKQEASVIGQQFDQMPADLKVSQLETMRKAIANDDIYKSVLASIRPDSPVTALIGNVAAVGSLDNAKMIAKGEDLLNPSKAKQGENGKGSFPMPSETYLRQSWSSLVGDAYRGYPDAESTAYQAFKAYYAASASAKGLNDPAAGVDAEIAQKAIAAATGGISRWNTDWFGNDTPSANVVMPYGMAPDIFKDKVTAQWNAMRESLGYTKTDASDIGLYNTGANGEYMVISGTSWLPGKDGKPIILRIQ